MLSMAQGDKEGLRGAEPTLLLLVPPLLVFGDGESGWSSTVEAIEGEGEGGRI